VTPKPLHCTKCDQRYW